jgi:hypothetical protein
LDDKNSEGTVLKGEEERYQICHPKEDRVAAAAQKAAIFQQQPLRLILPHNLLFFHHP